MQERYLGDSHDFVKYAILRRLRVEFGGPVGLNWYLTAPEAVDHPKSKDGEKRQHMTQPVWAQCDPDLLAGLRAFQDPAHRHIADFEASGLLPEDTRFVSALVPRDEGERLDWHRRAVAHLADCSVVFLDPDNGFEVKSMTRRTMPKYALFNEVRDYEATGAIVVTIQFARQCDPIARAAQIDAKRQSTTPALPVLRGRLAPNLLFFLSAPIQVHARLGRTLDTLIQSLPGKLEWIGTAQDTRI